MPRAPPSGTIPPRISRPETRGAGELLSIPFIGLTGGIGAGKSTALAALEQLGAATLSTDSVVHELYTSREVVDAVTSRFGEQVAPAGEVDRGALARAAFATEEDRRWLESLLWPRVGERMVQWRQELEERASPPRAAVVEIPLLFESDMHGAFDATIAVVAPEEVRAQRAASRGHEAVDERHTRQLPQEEKARRATYAVTNDGSEAELRDRLADVLNRL